uniref:TIR domain-containing protein n=2 Tax=Lactuca sativa TaxID=4236 RepID=A0A9R1UP96_LACSA|nr:hypothetical protein LSAT_V11C800409020 [Lactuca sativa]
MITGFIGKLNLSTTYILSQQIKTSMASSSSSPSAPAFSSQLWKYHVFLSFRGEDTRKNFVDHLYSALEQQGIYTYKDDETLPRGESIGPSLVKAIEESQIAVIIFSENYADSSWCLDELLCIMNCKDKKGQVVMPIFYDVDPSDVRKQKRKYGEAFSKHELENKNKVKSWTQTFVDNPWGWLFAPREQKQKHRESCSKQELENKKKVESWRKALVDASNISGWEPKHIANGHEAKVINEIVDTISQRLQLVTSSANENLIGLAIRMQHFKSDLQIGSGGVRMIGIWGVGGGGKTTLASSIYDEISSKFDGCCFVKNIRDESSKNGLEKLQEIILSSVLKKKQVNVIWRVEEGRQVIMDRLCHRKVLIVLDDVDQLDQLKALAGSHNWFGEGSRIIITTRDEHLLNAHKVNVMHNISLLNDDEAIKLLRKHACLDYRPMEGIEDYEQLSKEVVSYAGGLPLALTVLGSFLCDKNINEWRSALARLKEIPNDNIIETLKISFDGLTRADKHLFLDIACFFRSVKKDTAMEMLNACGFHSVIGVKVLIQKALITISEDGEFDMHDLVQEMGHHIVRGKHPKNPEKHSRLWRKEDLLKICAMDATMKLDKVEAIKVESDRLLEGQVLPPISANMKNLRYLFWIGDPANPLLNNFPPRELCCLILVGGLQKQLWEGCKYLPALRIIELYCLDHLIRTPDFDGLPNLEKLTLESCMHLEEINPSIGHLESLVLLSIERCESFKIFPPITRLKNLKTLIFTQCYKLFKPSEIQQQNMENLPHFHLDKEFCLEEPCLPPNNINHHIGSLLFHNLQEVGFLRKLDLSQCNLEDEDIGSTVCELPNLQELNLSRNKFSRLSFSHCRLPRLKWLNVRNCYDLVELTELPSSIAAVMADYCDSLETLGDISNCKWLWKVSLWIGTKLCGDILLGSMLQGNAIKDHFISVHLPHKISKAFVSRLFGCNTCAVHLLHDRGSTFTLCLPHDWYNDFCGFLMCVVTRYGLKKINIIIKPERDDQDPPFEVSQESNGGALEHDTSFIGYVSFSSLKRTTLLNPSYNILSFSTTTKYLSSFAAKLIPRKSKLDSMETTKIAIDCSEFWDEEEDHSPTFTIKQDSESCISILWRP